VPPALDVVVLVVPAPPVPVDDPVLSPHAAAITKASASKHERRTMLRRYLKDCF